MENKEKVIQGVTSCWKERSCDICPYKEHKKEDEFSSCMALLREDLLKEQQKRGMIQAEIREKEQEE